MFDSNNKVFIGDIDCTFFIEKFKIRSITRYRKLWNEMRANNYKFENFDEIDKFFINDIKVKRDILKYLFYIENKLGAEIIYFLLKEKEYVNNFLSKDGKLSFIQINKKNENKDINKININLEKKQKKEGIKDIFLIPDKLSFLEKIIFAKILLYYSTYSSNKIIFDLSFLPKDLRKFNELRNKIVHHEFILLNKNNLMKSLNSLGKYITYEYIEEYKTFIKKTNEILNNIYK